MTIGNVNINNNEVLIEFDNYVSDNLIIGNSGELIHNTIEPLSAARGGLSATSIGDYALFGGGSGLSAVVDAYSIKIPEYMRLELPLGSKYKFSEHITEQVADKSSILINSPTTGYVKFKKGII